MMFAAHPLPAWPQRQPAPLCLELPVREYAVVDFYDADGLWRAALVRHGTHDQVTPDLRALAQRLCAQPVAAILLRHGHPSGLAQPSIADIAATRTLAAFVRPLGVALHDHVIEAGNDRFSFRAEGLL